MASEIFAKIGDIKGESLDSRHQDEPIFQDLTIVHAIDNATPALLLACATGRRINEATISHRKAGPNQQDHLIVKPDGSLDAGQRFTFDLKTNQAG
jgi:type VI secretion system secreted protein Hcp